MSACPGAAVTKDYTEGFKTAEVSHFTVLGQKSQIQLLAGLCSLQSLWGRMHPGRFQLLVAPGVPCLMAE